MQSPDNILLLLLGAKKMMMILAFLMPAPRDEEMRGEVFEPSLTLKFYLAC